MNETENKELNETSSEAASAAEKNTATVKTEQVATEKTLAKEETGPANKPEENAEGTQKSNTQKLAGKKPEPQPKKGHKGLIIGLAVAVIACAGAGYGIYSYQQDQAKRTAAKAEAEDGLNVMLNAGADKIEYSNGDAIDTLTFVTATDGTDEHENMELTAQPATIDPKTVGKTEVTYTVSTKDSYGVEVSKDFEQTIIVQDTQVPVITANQDSYDITAGDAFDANSVVASVKDAVDGDLTMLSAEDAAKMDAAIKAAMPAEPAASAEPTESASSEATASAETAEGATATSETVAEIKGYYTITSNVDANTAGTYTVTINAEDKNGNTASKDVTVNVAEKPVEEAPAYSGSSYGGSSSYSGGSSRNYSGGSTSGSSYSGGSAGGSTSTGGSTQPAAPAQSVCMALDQVGQAYYSWADANNNFSNYTVGDADGDGCFVLYTNDGAFSIGQD